MAPASKYRFRVEGIEVVCVCVVCVYVCVCVWYTHTHTQCTEGRGFRFQVTFPDVERVVRVRLLVRDALVLLPRVRDALVLLPRGKTNRTRFRNGQKVGCGVWGAGCGVRGSGWRVDCGVPGAGYGR
jgi:hypothetical protein